MSAAGHDAGVPVVPGSRLRQFETNARGTVATLLRRPRHALPPLSRRTLLVGVAVAVAVLAATVALIDPWSLAHVRGLPPALVAAFEWITEFGRSGYFLIPLGAVLVLLAMLDTPAMPAFARHVLAAFAVRIGFVFTAIALPGLFVAILKRLIGRARPSVVGADPWTFHPLVWRADYASFPSGHTTTAFAALVAIGALMPGARPLLWIYAVAVAASRIAVTAHHPSDVLAGALVGAVGALLVRRWFAARGLAFLVDRDGAIRPRPGPRVQRIMKAVARRLRSA